MIGQNSPNGPIKYVNIVVQILKALVKLHE